MHTQSTLSFPIEKRCSRCREIKPAASFNRHAKAKLGLSSWCKACMSAYNRAWYESERGQRLASERYRRNTESGRNREYQRARRRRATERIKRLKEGKGCLICGENEPCTLDFHHVDPDTKESRGMAMSTFAGRYRVETLYAEIEKCVLLCSNCHRKIHAGVLELPALDPL